MRNELIGYLSIPVIVAGGMSVWKGLNPNQSILPSVKWSREDEDRANPGKDDLVLHDSDEAGEMEDIDDDGESSFAAPGAHDDR